MFFVLCCTCHNSISIFSCFSIIVSILVLKLRTKINPEQSPTVFTVPFLFVVKNTPPLRQEIV